MKKKSKNWPRPAFRRSARDLIFFLVCDRSCIMELWKCLAQKYILRFWRKVYQNDRNLDGYQIKERNTCLFGVKRVILVKNQTCFQKTLFSIDCDRSCMTKLPILVTGRFWVRFGCNLHQNFQNFICYQLKEKKKYLFGVWGKKKCFYKTCLSKELMHFQKSYFFTIRDG